jgi:hypothetical protein
VRIPLKAEGPAPFELLPESWTEKSVLTYGEQFYAGEHFVIRGATQGRGSVVRDRLGRQIRGNKARVARESDPPVIRPVESSRSYNANDQANHALVLVRVQLDAVRRFQAGERKVALAKELQLSSPELIEMWGR